MNVKKMGWISAKPLVENRDLAANSTSDRNRLASVNMRNLPSQAELRGEAAPFCANTAGRNFMTTV
jgi:hypothetical protein